MTAESPASPDAEPQERAIVLVADDSRVMRVALTRILKDEYTVLEAEHGEDAWAKLMAESGVQMVFSDLSMPELDGFGLLERIRNSELGRIRELPFIVITGNEDDQGVRKQALSQGATDFILKPFQSAEIKARAKAHVDHLRKLRAASSALEEKSTEDAATGLANQRFFMQRAGEALSFAARQRLEVGLLLIQLDRWQAFEQEHGGEAAGALLRALGEELSKHVRHEDVLAHFGDGRFALLSPAANRPGTRQLARRIREAVCVRKLAHQGVALGVTASIGIAVSDGRSEVGIHELLELSARLLSKAVRDGGDAVVEDDYLQAHDESAEAAATDEQDSAPAAPVDPAVLERLRIELAEARQAAETRQVELERVQQLQAESDRRIQELEAETQHAAGVGRQELEAEQLARKSAEQTVEQLRTDLARVTDELEQIKARAAQADAAREAAESQAAAAKADAQELQQETREQAQQLEAVTAARQQAESELAKLKLQEVSRREDERLAAEAAQQRAARGFLARVLDCLRGGKP